MVTAPYAGQTATLATRHAKDRAIAPVFHTELDVDVIVVDVDTDAFGTFAGEIPRVDTPLNTAIAKARAGMEISGRSLGIASEGTIGPDPLIPFTTADIETITFVDDDREIIVSETIRSTEIIAVREIVSTETDLTNLLERADFPQHGLIVRTSDLHAGPIFKGITDTAELLAAIATCHSDSGSAVVESDLRANFSPSRMRNIHACAEKLAQRLATLCPQCESPGWGLIEPARGLPCSVCGSHVESAIQADVFGCQVCPTVREVVRPEQTVDPRWCPLCNP